MNNKTLASVVKEAREKLGISQRELSRRTGIDNNTVAKIEKGERKKPNVLSLRKLSSVLLIDYEELMKLCDYSKEDIEATKSNSYSSMVIKSENAPIFMLDDLVNQIQEELYIKLIIKELLTDCDIENLNTISELNSKEKSKVIKSIKKYIKENDKEIESKIESINNLNSLLTKEK